jgi:hypothetical protein
MPFDPTLPTNNSPNSSAQMRGQLNGLKDLIDAIPAGPQGPPGNDGAPGIQGTAGEVTAADLSNALAGCSANSNGVSLLNLSFSDPPTQAEVQAMSSKLNELINALRR